MDTKQCKGLGIREESLELVLAGMLDACSAGGTAFPFFTWNTEHRRAELRPYQALAEGAVACKTGTAEFGATTGDNKKKTHGWFTMIVTTEQLLKAQQEKLQTATESARRATAATAHYTDQGVWLALQEKHSFPKTIVITILVESDERAPYREGSRDAAPVAKKIMDWMMGVQSVPAVVAPPPGTIAE